MRMNCPNCNELLIQMSGVRLQGHRQKHLWLCFNCKEWRDRNGEFVQTI